MALDVVDIDESSIASLALRLRTQLCR